MYVNHRFLNFRFVYSKVCSFRFISSFPYDLGSVQFFSSFGPYCVGMLHVVIDFRQLGRTRHPKFFTRNSLPPGVFDDAHPIISLFLPFSVS